jgi:hypothetical protein
MPLGQSSTSSDSYNSQYIPSMRICWLSSPDVATDKIRQSFNNWDHVRNLISKYSQDSCDILWWKSPEWVNDYSSTTVLMQGGVIDSDTPGIYQEGLNDLFSRELYWYSFRHYFLSNQKHVVQKKRKFIPCVEIDSLTIFNSIDELWIKDFKKFEKSLGLLMSIMSHDASTHRVWVTAREDKTWWNLLFWDYIWYNQEILDTPLSQQVNQWEIVAAAFHRDMFEEIDELWIPLKQSVMKHANIILTYIDQIKNKDLQKYWISVLKYPLFSLLNPSWEEIEQLRNKFPSVSLNSTDWWNMVHQQKLECNISWESKQKIEVSLRDVRRIMMGYYYSQTDWVEVPLAKLVAQQWGYREPKNWMDLINIHERESSISNDS